PAEDAEGVGVAFEEGFLSRRGTDALHGLAGVGESEAEQRASDKLAPQPDGHITEVDLCLPAREVLLWDERGCGSRPASIRISRRRVATYSRTIPYEISWASCSSRSRSKIRLAV